MISHATGPKGIENRQTSDLDRRYAGAYAVPSPPSQYVGCYGPSSSKHVKFAEHHRHPEPLMCLNRREKDLWNVTVHIVVWIALVARWLREPFLTVDILCVRVADNQKHLKYARTAMIPYELRGGHAPERDVRRRRWSPSLSTIDEAFPVGADDGGSGQLCLAGLWARVCPTCAEHSLGHQSALAPQTKLRAVRHTDTDGGLLFLHRGQL
ncbi:hypothetical protein PENSPDRAFT_338818 [Peniophora sp. CONT]|nr:hypothetical protein PENSPDRAFT_338818 [Peniophora sp. CONT]